MTDLNNLSVNELQSMIENAESALKLNKQASVKKFLHRLKHWRLQ